MTVDTLSLARELKLVPAQAGGTAGATKADLAQLGAHLDAKFDQLRVTMMTWFIGSTLTVSALLVAALKL